VSIDPSFTDIGSGDATLTAGTSDTIKTGGFDVCGGSYGDCDYVTAISPNRSPPTDPLTDTGDNLTTNWIDAGGFGMGAYPYIVGNTIPVATITTPTSTQTITEGQTVDFAGTCTDADNDSTTAAWDFDGNQVTDSTDLDPSAHTYNTAGTYTCNFKCNDGTSDSVADTLVVIVNASGGGGYVTAFESDTLSTNTSITPAGRDLSLRDVIDASTITDGTYTKGKITIQSATGTDRNLKLSGISICEQDSTWECLATPVRIQVSGGNTTDFKGNQTSDEFTISTDGTVNLIIHQWFDGDGSTTLWRRRQDLGATSAYFKQGASLSDETMIQAPTGYAATDFRSSIIKIELFDSGGSQPPTILQASTTTDTGVYILSDTIDGPTLLINEAVTVTGTPQVVLADSLGTLDFSSGSTTTAIVFDDYTVGGGDNGTYDIESIDLNGGTINATDGGTPMSLVLPDANNIFGIKVITIDTTGLSLADVGHWDEGTSTFTANKTLSVTSGTFVLGLQLSEVPANPIGDPDQMTLSLVTGFDGSTSTIPYNSTGIDGSSVNYFNFLYTATAGHRTLDLQTDLVGSALDLNTATVTDVGGTALTTTLPATDVGTISIGVAKTFSIGTGGDYADLAAALTDFTANSVNPVKNDTYLYTEDLTEDGFNSVSMSGFAAASDNLIEVNGGGNTITFTAAATFDETFWRLAGVKQAGTVNITADSCELNNSTIAGTVTVSGASVTATGLTITGTLDIDEDMTLSNSLVEDGAIDLATGKTLTVSNSRFRGTKAGIEAGGGTVTDTNCLFSYTGSVNKRRVVGGGVR
jgi:hypothetical protein